MFVSWLFFGFKLLSLTLVLSFDYPDGLSAAFPNPLPGFFQGEALLSFELFDLIVQILVLLVASRQLQDQLLLFLFPLLLGFVGFIELILQPVSYTHLTLPTKA